MRSKMALAGLVIGLPLVFSVQKVGADPNIQFDSCDTILLKGVFDTDTLKRDTNVYSAARDWMCLDESSKKSMGSSFGASLGIPLPDAPAIPLQLGVNDSQQSAAAWAKKHCRDGKRNTTLSDAFEHTKKVASQAVITAWSECKAGTSAGLKCSTKNASGKRFTFDYGWHTTTSGETWPKVTGVTLLNAKCEAAPSVGVTLTSADAMACSRVKEDEEAIILLRTDKGACHKVIPAVPPPAPPTPKQVCAEGTAPDAASACEAFGKELTTSCNADPGVCRERVACITNRAILLRERDATCEKAKHDKNLEPMCAQVKTDLNGRASMQGCENPGPGARPF